MARTVFPFGALALFRRAAVRLQVLFWDMLQRIDKAHQQAAPSLARCTLPVPALRERDAEARPIRSCTIIAEEPSRWGQGRAAAVHTTAVWRCLPCGVRSLNQPSTPHAARR